MKQSEMLAVLKELSSDLLRYAAGSDSIVPGAYAEALDEAIEQFEKYMWHDAKVDKPEDVEHVIRCKDCSYCRELSRELSRALRRNDPYENRYIEGCMWCMNISEGVMPDDYCSSAKRKEDINGNQNH